MLSPLKENTKVTLNNVALTNSSKGSFYVVFFTMTVDEETTEFLSYANIQEIILPLTPFSVEKISLDGNVIFSSEKVTILTN